MFKAFATLELNVAELALKNLIVSDSLRPFKVLSAFGQTLTLTAVPLTVIVVNCKLGLHALLDSL